MKKITPEEARELEDYWKNRGEELAQFYQSLGYKDIKARHFFSDCLTTCYYGYTSGFTYVDPKTGKECRGRKLPQKYRDDFKFSGSAFCQLYHFSPSGCHSLKPFHSRVECLARIQYEYFLTRNRVGECPHKSIMPREKPRVAELPPGLIPPYISKALIGRDELVIGTQALGHVPGEFPMAYRRKKLPFAQYLEHNDSMIWLFEYGYRISAIQKFFRRHPRPANQETYTQVGIYDDDSYWGPQANNKPMRVAENVTLLELWEILKEFAPDQAR